MVYVTSDGRILQNKPWSLRRLYEFFWAIINFIVFFFRSLFGLGNSNTFSSVRRNDGGSSGSGGGGGPGGGPRRNVHMFRDMKELQDCSMPGGG